MTVGDLFDNPERLFAIVYAVATGLVMLFQLGLAAGKPWGAWAIGGRWPGRLPPLVRVLEVMQAALLGLLAVIVLDRAGLVEASWLPDVAWLAWIPVVVSGLSLLMNASSHSEVEKRTWTPVALVMVASSLGVVLLTS